MVKQRIFTALLVIALLLSNAATAAEAQTTHNISVYGSSVASGIAAEENHGYWYRLKECLADRGWNVSSCSRGGDRTNRILDRFDDLLSQNPHYVFIGLSLANEGIRNQGTAEKDSIYRQYIWGMKALITLIRSQGMVPVVGLCYPNGDYTPQEYEYIKRMNLLTNTWDVPSTNFLGAIGDGHGRWVEGFSHDPGHPNTAGHREMFYAMVPGLFDAMEAGKPIPQKADGSGFLSLGREHPGTVRFATDDTIHSWAMAFNVRCGQDGTLAVIEGEKNNADISVMDGKIVCQSTGRQPLVSEMKVRDGQWHGITVSHRYALQQTQLFVDGRLAGTRAEQFEPKAFSLGGNADFKEWLVYRAALDDLEVQALANGQLLQASLEVYAPLQDTAFTNGKPVENRAQSLSQAIFMTGTPEKHKNIE